MRLQLPLKSQKGGDSSRKLTGNKSQERGTLSNNSNSSQPTQVFNSVTIRNIKNNFKVSNTLDEVHFPSQQNLPPKSPQSRQGGVQVQGQGNMISQRLVAKNAQP